MLLSISCDYSTSLVINIFYTRVDELHCAVLHVESGMLEEYAATVFHG